MQFQLVSAVLLVTIFCSCFSSMFLFLIRWHPVTTCVSVALLPYLWQNRLKKNCAVGVWHCHDGGLFSSCWLKIFCPKMLSKDEIVDSRDQYWLFDYCLIIHNVWFIEYPTMYSIIFGLISPLSCWVGLFPQLIHRRWHLKLW